MSWWRRVVPCAVGWRGAPDSTPRQRAVTAAPGDGRTGQVTDCHMGWADLNCHTDRLVSSRVAIGISHRHPMKTPHWRKRNTADRGAQSLSFMQNLSHTNKINDVITQFPGKLSTNALAVVEA